MKKSLSLAILFFALLFPYSNAEVTGTVDFDRVIDKYNKVKISSDEMSDKYAEIQRYTLDKEREYKKLTTPLERKNFEEATARELARKQEAYMKLKEKKEAEIELAIKNAVKQVAIENKIDTVIDQSTVFYGGVDITDKVIKALNTPR